MKAFLSIILLLQAYAATAQLEQLKHVASNGGVVSEKQGRISISIAGEMAVKRLVNSKFDGTIGFLDYERILFPAAVLQPTLGMDFQLIPNPAEADVKVIMVNVPFNGFNLSVTDMAGRIIWNQKYSGESHYVTIDAKIFPAPGSYIISIIADKYHGSKELLVIR